MATEKQIEANRRNALSSSGPTTAAGKARSAANSTIHGLRGKRVLLNYEDPDEYDQLGRELMESFRPVGPVEQHCVEQVRDAMWRIRRAGNAEQAAILFYQALPDARKMLNDNLGIPVSVRFSDQSLTPLNFVETAHVTQLEEILAELDAIDPVPATWSGLQQQAPAFCRYHAGKALSASLQMEKHIQQLTGLQAPMGGNLLCALVAHGEKQFRPQYAAYESRLKIQELRHLRNEMNVVPPESARLCRYHAEHEALMRKALKLLFDLQERRQTVMTVARAA